MSGKCDVSLIGLFVLLSSLVHLILSCPAANRNISFKKSAIPLQSFRNIPLQPMPIFFKLDLAHQKSISCLLFFPSFSSYLRNLCPSSSGANPTHQKHKFSFYLCHRPQTISVCSQNE